MEDGESDEMAAVRETREELGLQVEIARLLGTVTFGPSTQTYFEVCAVGGEFGTGDGAAMSSARAYHFDSSFKPSRINCAVSAFSPALREAAAMAAEACGWP